MEETAAQPMTTRGGGDPSGAGGGANTGPACLPLIVRDDRGWRGGGGSRGGDVSTVINPWNDAPVASIPNLAPDELEDALSWAADRVGNSAAWPVADRIDVMQQWSQQIARHGEEIARMETREMGKPIRQTRKIIDMVVRRIADLCVARKTMRGECFATEATRATARAQGFSMREPFGLTAGILPFNSPVSALVWKIAPALLMGNAVVIKLSELAPIAALQAAHLLAALPLPQGALQVVHGRGNELGPVLSQHPGVRKISFTGSTPAGVDVCRRSAATFKRLTLECGSNDAAVVLRDADLAHAAKTVADLGIRTYAGQICTAPKRCIVAKEIYNGFEQMLAGEAARTNVGDPLDARTELGPLVNAAAAEQVERQVQESIAAGARLVCGGGPRDRATFPPTILADVTPAHPIFHEGAFGPVVCLIPAADERDAVALANQSPYALRAAVFGRDIQRAAAVAQRLDCGGVAINGPSLIDNPRLNVEPRRMSGLGAEGVYASLLEYSQPKFIWINDWWPGN